MPKAKKTDENSTVKKPSTRASKTTGGAAAAPAEARTPQPVFIDEEQVRRRAYELFLERNGNGGDPQEDWYRAEAELRGKTA